MYLHLSLLRQGGAGAEPLESLAGAVGLDPCSRKPGPVPSRRSPVWLTLTLCLHPSWGRCLGWCPGQVSSASPPSGPGDAPRAPGLH